MFAANGILALAGLYLLAGLVFAVAFVGLGVGHIDPAARGAGLLVRLMWLPGAAAFWPILLKKWISS
jgi:hypothetical protein